MPKFDLLDTTTIDSRILDLIQDAPLPELNELPKSRQSAANIEQLTSDRSSLRPELLAGLWLLAGELEKSHAVSQNLQSKEGSLWHAMMHRREGDFWNSKYWYRKAGAHPIWSSLVGLVSQVSETPIPRQQIHIPSTIQELLSKQSQPHRWLHSTTIAEAIVDSVELALSKHQDWQLSLQQVCWWEWQLLFQYCWENQ